MPRLNPEIERKACSHGPIITYTLSPEAMERMNSNRLTKENEEISRLEKELAAAHALNDQAAAAYRDAQSRMSERIADLEERLEDATNRLASYEAGKRVPTVSSAFDQLGPAVELLTSLARLKVAAAAMQLVETLDCSTTKAKG